MNGHRPSVKLRWRRALIRDTRGATAVEYGLMLALVVLALITALVGVADATSGIWNNVADKVIKAR